LIYQGKAYRRNESFKIYWIYVRFPLDCGAIVFIK